MNETNLVKSPIISAVILSGMQCWHALQWLTCICNFAGTKGLLNKGKTVSFVMNDPEARRQLAAIAAQSLPPQPAPPSPPSQPRAGFLRSHLQHFRASSHGDKQLSPSGSTNTDSSHLSHVSGQDQQEDANDGESEQGLEEHSLSAVLLANAQPMGRRSGSLDRLQAVQRTSLRLPQESAKSRSLLDNGSAISATSQGAQTPTLSFHASCA